MKYVIIKVNRDKLGITQVIPVIFPDIIVHKDMAEYVIHMIMMSDNEPTELPIVNSAGFCDLETGRCWGRSESLEVESSVADKYVIKYADSASCIEEGVSAAYIAEKQLS